MPCLKKRREHRIDNNNVDRLHGLDALPSRQATKRLHDKCRERKECAGHEGAAEGGEKCERNLGFGYHSSPRLLSERTRRIVAMPVPTFGRMASYPCRSIR